MTFIPVGRVVSVHGVRGEIRFRYYNEDAAASLEYPSFFIDDNGMKRELKPSRIRTQGKLFIMKFEGLDTVEDARSLAARELFVREEDLAPLGQDEYYDYQLIGLTAVGGQGRRLGTVEDVMHTGAGDILVVGGAREILVPMIDDYVVAVHIKDGMVQIREDGLVE
jgi:16S rRNA processing protein RimM